MKRYQLKSGRIVRVFAHKETKFQNEHPDATLLTTGFNYENHIYHVSPDKMEKFEQEHAGAINMSTGKAIGSIKNTDALDLKTTEASNQTIQAQEELTNSDSKSEDTSSGTLTVWNSKTKSFQTMTYSQYIKHQGKHLTFQNDGSPEAEAIYNTLSGLDGFDEKFHSKWRDIVNSDENWNGQSDINNLSTLIDKDQDTVVYHFEQAGGKGKFPGLSVMKAGSAWGNAIEFVLPDGTTQYVNLIPCPLKGDKSEGRRQCRLAELEKMKVIEQWYEENGDNPIVLSGMGKVLGDWEKIGSSYYYGDNELKALNDYFDKSGLGFRIETGYDGTRIYKTIDGEEVLVAGDSAADGYLDKDGNVIRGAKMVTDYFYNNLSKEELAKITSYELELHKGLIAEHNAEETLHYNSITNEMAIKGLKNDERTVAHIKLAWEERVLNLIKENERRLEEGLPLLSIPGDMDDDGQDDDLAIILEFLEKEEMEWIHTTEWRDVNVATPGMDKMGVARAGTKKIEVDVTIKPEDRRARKYDKLMNEIMPQLSKPGQDLLKQLIDEQVGFSDQLINNWKNEQVMGHMSKWWQRQENDNKNISHLKAAIDQQGGTLDTERELLNARYDLLSTEMEKKQKQLDLVGNNLFEMMKANGIGWEIHGEDENMYVTVTGYDDSSTLWYQTEINEWLDSTKKVHSQFKEILEETYIPDFDAWQAKYQDNILLAGSLNKEFNNAAILMEEFSNGWQKLFVGIPAAFGHKSSVRRLQGINEGAIGYEDMFTFDEAIATGNKWRYYSRTMSQQAANVIVAVGGTALGMPAWALPVLFGLSSAGDTRAGLQTTVDHAEDAKQRLLALERNKHLLTAEEYRSQRINLEHTAMLGDMNWAQINGAVLTAGLIEGGLTYLFGTKNMTFGFFDDLGRIGGGGKQVGDILFRSNAQAWKDWGKQVTIAAGKEILEETLIYSSTELSHLAIGVNKDLSWNSFWRGFADTGMSALMVGGTMNGTTSGYGTMRQQMVTAPIRNEVQGLVGDLNNLKENLASLDPNLDGYQQQVDQIKKQFAEKYQALDWIGGGIEVDALLTGKEGLENLVKNSFNLHTAWQEANIKPTDSDDTKKKKIEDHVKKLTEEGSEKEAKWFKTRIDMATEAIQAERNKVNTLLEGDGADMFMEGGLVEKIWGKQGLEIAKELGAENNDAYGLFVEDELYGGAFKDSGRKYRKRKQEQEMWNKLMEDSEFGKLSNRDKLTVIHKRINKQFADKQLQNTKKNKLNQAFVETKVYGDTFANTGRKRKTAKEKKLEEKWYQHLSRSQTTRVNQAITTHRNQKENLSTILKENNINELSDLEVVADNSEDGIMNFMRDNTDLSSKQKSEFLHGLKNGSIKGMIFNGKYLVMGEKESVQKELNRGNVLQGTVFAHEFGHAIDGLTMKRGELNRFSKGIFDFISNNKKLSEIHGLAIKRLSSLHFNGRPLWDLSLLNKDGSMSFDKQSDRAKDEYSKAVQDFLMDPVYEDLLVEARKAKSGFRNIVRGVVLGDFKFETASDSMNYLVSYIDSFNKGELSKKVKRKISAKRSAVKDLKQEIKILEKKVGKLTKSDKRKMDIEIQKAIDNKTQPEFKGKKAKLKEAEYNLFLLESGRKADELLSMEHKDSQQASADNTNDVNELAEVGWDNKTWKEQGADFALERMQEEGLFDDLIGAQFDDLLFRFNKKADPSKHKQFIDEVYSELLPHIRRYKPEEKNESGLFGWINAFLRKKALNVFLRNYKNDPALEGAKDIEGKTEEGAPLIQITADNQSEQDFIDKIGLTDNQAEQYSRLRKDLNLDESMINKIRHAVVKIFGTKLPNIDSKLFRAELEKSFRTELKKEIQDMLGSRQTYDKFLGENMEAVFRALPVETLIQMERTVAPENRIFTESRRITKPTEVDRLVSEGLLPKDTNRLSGPQLHIKKSYPGTDKILAFYRGVNMKEVLGYEVGSSTLGTRKDKLAMEIGVELAFDATSEVLLDPAIQEKRQGILELQGLEQAENELAIIAKQINRDPNVKFSADRIVSKEASTINANIYFANRSMLLQEIDEQGSFTVPGINRAFVNTFGRIFPNKLKDKIVKKWNTLLNPFDKIRKEDYKKDSDFMAVEEFVLKENLDNQPDAKIAQFLGLDVSAVNLFTDTKQKKKYKAFVNDIFSTRIKRLMDKGVSEAKARTQVIAHAIQFQSSFQDGTKAPRRAMAFDNKNNLTKELLSNIYPGIADYKLKGRGESRVAEIYDSKGKLLETVSVPMNPSQKVSKDMITNNLTPQEKTYRKKNAKANWDNLNSTFEIAVELINTNPHLYSNIEMAMLSAGFLGNMKTSLRAAADFRYAPNKPSDLNPNNYRYEHGVPAKVVMLHLINHHFYGQKVDLNKLQDSFSIGAIHENMDVNVNRMFSDRMNLGYKVGDGPLKRWFNEFTARGPLHSVIDTYTGKVHGEQYTKLSKKINESQGQKEKRDNIETARDNTTQYMKSEESIGMSTFDFDDTLAQTKSGVRVNIPNADGLPKTARKVIFLAGGAGSGKSSVVKKLGLENKGMKIVNQDISLEWLKKNSGLPENMNDLTKEQRSILGKLQHQARGIAKRKMMKFQGKGEGVVVDGTGASMKQMTKLVNEFKEKGYEVSMLFVETDLNVALERNRNRKERSLLDFIVRKNHESVMANKEGFMEMFGEYFMNVDTSKMKLEDDMPQDLKDKADHFLNSFERRRLDAEEFANEGQSILEQGGKFDFSEFNKVVDGQKGPLFEKAINVAKKHGTKNMFILTARPAESAQAIHEFLKSQGLNIPLENITGLANSDANAKADWMLKKFAEGYNDMYFVDDAIQNVEAVKTVLDQLDIKSKVVQTRFDFSKDASKDFNDMLFRKFGIRTDKVVSLAEAKKKGADKGKWRFFVPPSAEDFKGLMYNFLGKGKQGDIDMKWVKEKLLDPFARGTRTINDIKQQMTSEYTALRKEFPDISKNLQNEIKGTEFTNDTAIRIYLWNKAGFNIPGIDIATQQMLVDHVENNESMKAFADGLSIISRLKDGYMQPSKYWMIESISSDLNAMTRGDLRKKAFAEWIENKNNIFSEDNLNKIESELGAGFREALENILYRMENGTNRLVGTKDGPVKKILDWINGSVGATMFWNVRSAMLQTISTVNFLNFEDNNIFAASKAFANQKQFWKDFSFIFNSNMLKQRRAGLQIDVHAAELSQAFDGKPQSILKYLLEKGFTPTRIADSFAIAFGGASFYRNALNKYEKQGMKKNDAMNQAWLDFQEIAEETQQSSRPDLISQQQAGPLGRLILAWQNTPMQ